MNCGLKTAGAVALKTLVYQTDFGFNFGYGFNLGMGRIQGEYGEYECKVR